MRGAGKDSTKDATGADGSASVDADEVEVHVADNNSQAMFPDEEQYDSEGEYDDEEYDDEEDDAYKTANEIQPQSRAIQPPNNAAAAAAAQ